MFYTTAQHGYVKTPTPLSELVYISRPFSSVGERYSYEVVVMGSIPIMGIFLQDGNSTHSTTHSPKNGQVDGFLSKS